MNILKRKLSISFVILVVLFSCHQPLQNKKVQIKTIFKGLHVSGNKHYSYTNDLESMYILQSDTFSLRIKADYDKNGKLSNLTLYKPEGSLRYTSEEVLNDLKLLDFTGIKYKQNWNYIADSLLIDKTDSLKVKQIKGENGKTVLVNNQRYSEISTIFELY